MRTAAAQVVGYAGLDAQGLAGMEYQYDRELAGRPGKQVVVQDPAGRALRTIQSIQPVPGQDVRLTIDNGIQLMADRVLADTVRLYHAKGGTAIVENPKTGEIYAMSNVPLVNANRFGDFPKDQGNKAIIYSYEPGSTFKAVTVGGALSDGVVKPTTRFSVPGAYQVGDRVIHDSELHGTETPDRPSDPRAVEQHRRGEDRPEARPGQTALLDRARSASASRPASTSRVRCRASCCPATSGGARRSATCRWDRASP